KTRSKYGYPADVTNDSWITGYTPQYTMSVWTGYPKNGSGNYMVGDTTHISQLMFKKMMQAFGTDKSSFKQPSDVYRVGNDLYIQGSRDIPPKPEPIIKQSHGKQKGKFKIGKEKGNKKKKKKH
ncbi:MAG TPA: penicillin-binding protein, partial [Pseudoneobacillus sp.]|nr:penicillin-binding protein [Pseudoneobacillus sp.]